MEDLALLRCMLNRLEPTEVWPVAEESTGREQADGEEDSEQDVGECHSDMLMMGIEDGLVRRVTGTGFGGLL